MKAVVISSVLFHPSSSLQLLKNDSPKVPIHTGVENRSYVDQDWHSEYGNGHYPGWKEVFDDYHIPNAHSYEDKQSDGKPGH